MALLQLCWTLFWTRRQLLYFKQREAILLDIPDMEAPADEIRNDAFR